MDRACAPGCLVAVIVLTVVLTGVALVSIGLVTGDLPSPWTPIKLYEGVFAALIIAAALSAAFARSSLIAALSLGAVGYGVALIYALFGAPDLAMTQFAVETLTVVISRARLLPVSRIRQSIVAHRQDTRCFGRRCGWDDHRDARSVHRSVRNNIAIVAVFCRRVAAARSWTECRQCDPGRLSWLRHARRNHRTRHGRDRRPGTALIGRERRP